MISGNRAARIPLGTFVLMLLLVAGGPVRATWYYPNTRKGSDIILGQVRWPFWSKGTYYALWNSATFPEGAPYYGGVAPYGPGAEGTPEEQAAYRPQLVWSFWDGPAYDGRPVRPLFTGEPFYGGSMSGEGATAGFCGYFPYLRPNAWMLMLKRAWPSPDAPDEKGYLGWWVQDVERDLWYCIGVAEVPCAVTGLTGTACFVEDCGAGADAKRLFDRRLWYNRLDGVWHKVDSVRVDGKVPVSRFEVIEDGTVLRFRQPEPDPTLSGQPDNTYTVRQPDEPDLDEPAVRNVRAVSVPGQLLVSWEIPRSAAPQLGYRIEAFASDPPGGTPSATAESALPFVTMHRLDVPGPVASVRLTIRDIFDREVAAVVRPGPAVPLAAAELPDLRPGLRFRYYEAPDGIDWTALPDVSDMQPASEGIVRGLDDTVSRGRTKRFAVSYRGLFRAPRPGLYLFETRSSDGCRLVLDGEVVGLHDGVHGPTPRRFGVALAAGLHAFELDYFKSAYADMDGWLSRRLWLGVEAPGTPMREVGPGDFRCADTGDTPTIRLETRPGDGGPGTEIAAVLDMRGQEFDRVEVYRGPIGLGVVTRIEPAGEARLRVLLPTGENPIRARLWYGGNRAVDSEEIRVEAESSLAAPWSLQVIGEKDLPRGISAAPDRVSLSGEGAMYVHREVTGDFVMTGRLADFLHTTPENGVLPRSWLGIMAAARVDPPWGTNFGLWDTAGGNLHGAPDDRDLETSMMNRSPLGQGDRWLRIARRGTRWTGYLSGDGATWRKVVDRIDNRLAAETVHAGVVFHTVPGKNRTLFHGTVDTIRIEQPGVLPDEPRTEPGPGDTGVSAGEITGIVRAGPGGVVLLARGNGVGVLHSTDAGESWKPLNGGVTVPEALSVRSVAVHPTDPSILLRGGGLTVDGVRRSGLLRSADGGATWVPVSSGPDFDGSGSRARFGETLCFNPHDPSVVAAGGETTGLFISRDAGVTWESAGLRGEPIACVAFSPHRKDLLVVGTCPADALNAPGTATGLGRLYVSTNAGRDLKPTFEMPGWGVTNVSFESIAEGGNIIYGATTRGLYYTFDLGAFYQRRAGVVPDRLHVALDEIRLDIGRSETLAGPFGGSAETPMYCGRIGYFWSPVWQALPRAPHVAGQPAGEAGSWRDGFCAGVYLGNPDAFCIVTRSGIFKTEDRGASFRRTYAGGAP